MTAAAEPITQEEVESLEKGFAAFEEVKQVGLQLVETNPRATYLSEALQSRFSQAELAAFVIASSEASLQAVQQAYRNGFERGAYAVATGEVQVEVLSDEELAAEALAEEANLN